MSDAPPNASLVTEYINELGGYNYAKDRSIPWLLNHGLNWRNVKEAVLLEYRRINKIFEIQDQVFLKDANYCELYFITNILNDGRIELKTASQGWPVPDQCWGLYYGYADGLDHATEEEIKIGKRKAT